MWVIFLSLFACNPENKLEEDPAGPAGPETPSVKAGSEDGGAGRIATRAKPMSAPPKRVEKGFDKPSTALIQTDCYNSSRDYDRRPRPAPRPSPSPAFKPGAFGTGAAPPPPAMAPSPPQRAAKGAAREEGSLGDLAAASGGASTSADAGPPPPMASAPAMEPAARSVSERKREMAPRDEEAPMADPTPLGRRAAEKSDAKDKDASGEWAKPYRQQPPAQPVLDWGATVYLSNDDSMSLASAQRLLWAVDRGAGFSSGEVRPHELLNYFSFDTAPVAPGETFSVLGGAEQDGDTLSVALAVQGAMPPRQPLDLTLVIDRSGSMRAEGRMEYVRKGLVQMTDQLVPGDRVDLVLFDSAVCSPLQNFVVGRDDPSILTNELLRMQPRGSTDLDGGLREGYRIQTARDKGDRHNRNQRVLLLTDAMLNSGNVNEALVSEIGKRFDEDGIRVTGVGVGREFNDKMLNKITEKGKGAYVYLGSEAVVDRVFGAGFDSLVQTIAHDVQFSIDLPDSLAMEKFYGEESSTNAEDVQPINYYAGTSQLFLQDLKVKGGRVDPKAEIVFRAKFREATTGEPKESTFRTSVGALLEGDTHNLKKAQALMKWTDLLSERAMGDRSCGGLGDYRRAAAQVQGDAEIAYVSGLTGKLCGVDMSQTIAATGVKFKVKVDADMPIPEVQLACSGESWSNRLSGSDTVARFDNVYPGECRLTLQGNVPMVAAVTVPETGGDVRCMVRGGRMSCD